MPCCLAHTAVNSATCTLPGLRTAPPLHYSIPPPPPPPQAPDKLRDPLSGPRRDGSPIKARSSMTGGVPNWVKAMQADPGAGAIMTSGQDIRGIPVIDTPDSDDEAPRKPAPRKSMAPGVCGWVCLGGGSGVEAGRRLLRACEVLDQCKSC